MSVGDADYPESPRTNRRPDERAAHTPGPSLDMRVAMLVRNTGQFDTRVRKEAVALATRGYQVRVLALSGTGIEQEETVDGVTYVRIENAAHDLLRARQTYTSLQGRLRNVYFTRREKVGLQAQLRARRHRTFRATLIKTRRRALLSAADRRRAGRASARALSLLRIVIKQTARRVLLMEARAVRFESLARRKAFGLHRYGYRRCQRLLVGGWSQYRRLHAALVPVQYHRNYLETVRAPLEEFRPDVVHAHDLNTLYAASRFARTNGCRLVYDAHEFELHRNTTWTPLKRLVARYVEYVGVRRAAAVITVSPSIAAEMARMYRCAPPRVILNSPPLEARELSSPVDLKKEAGLGPDAVLFVYVGVAARGRGLEELIEALGMMSPEFHIGILGPRDPIREPVLLDRAAELGVSGRVHLFDPLPPLLVPAALRTADGSVNPLQNICRSYDLALPNKHFDAVMAGVPMAVSDLEELGRFIREHALGVCFDETDPAAIASALAVLLRETPEGIRDRERLRRLQETVCWEKQATVLADIYASFSQVSPASEDRGGVEGEAVQRLPCAP